MSVIPGNLEQLTPLGIMGIAVVYLLRMVLDQLKAKAPDKIDALAITLNARLLKLETTLKDLDSRHRDPLSLFATVTLSKEQALMKTEQALIRADVLDIKEDVKTLIGRGQ